MFIFRTVFRWFRRALYVLFLVVFIYLVVTSAEVIMASSNASARPHIADGPVVVVVGSATGRTISKDLENRCDLAYALYKNHHARELIVTGQAASGEGASAAVVGAAYLTKKGIKGVKEAVAGDIPAQLGRVTMMLTSSERQHVVLVDDPLQTKWLQDLATAEGLSVQMAAAPTPKQGFWQDAGIIWHQSLAVGYGRIFGYKSSGWIGG